MKAYGITRVFAVPGEENLDFVQSLKNHGIEMIVVRNEQTAVFMAATQGRLTGEPGVALATLGPWATNMVTWVAYAQLGGLPVIVITGQKPIKKSKQGAFQIIDTVAMMKPLTKYAISIVDGRRIPSVFANAYEAATQERPWAVHIELPEDIAGENIVMDGWTANKPEKIRRPQIDDKQRHMLIKELESARRPLLLVWAWANRKRVTKFLTQFVTQYNIPFFTSQMGKGVIDERLPQYIGTAGLTSNDRIHPVIAASDCIIAVGHDIIEKPTNLIEPGKTRVIHINFTPAMIDFLYEPTMQVIGDIGNTFWQLCEAHLSPTNRDLEPLYALSKNQREKKQHYEAWLSHPGSVSLPSLIQTIRHNLADQDIVALDNGLYKVWFARNYPTYHPNTLLLDNALATMGAWYSSAMMAKILNPDKHVVAVVGDGWLVMNLWDLATIRKHGLTMTIIILNNNSYGMIQRKQVGQGFDDWGMWLDNPDFVMLAKSFGANYAVMVSDEHDFDHKLKQSLMTPWLSVLVVPIHYPLHFFPPQTT